MYVDPTQVLCDLDEKPILDGQSHDLDPEGKVVLIEGKPRLKGGKELTFGMLIVQLALAQFEGEEKMSGDKKMDRMELAEKFHKQMLPVEISREQRAEIEKLAEKGCGSLLYTRVKRILVKAEAEKQVAKTVNGKAEEVRV